MNLLVLLAFAFRVPVDGGSDPGAGVTSRPSPAAPTCDGEPPVLTNADAVPWSFTLTCGDKVTPKTAAPGEKLKLEGFSGCTLTLGTITEKLHTEMVCTVKAGPSLTCDLL